MMARPTKAKAMERLRKVLSDIPELKGIRRGSPAFKLYVPLDDNDGWKMRLLRELKAADFDMDATQALSA